MRPTRVLMIAATILTLSSGSAFSDTTISFDPYLMRECTQADGSILYTNKDLPGCKLMTLKELSSVPSLEDMPTYRPAVTAAPRYDIPPYPDRNQTGMAGGRQTVPDWAKDWLMPVSPRPGPFKLKSAPCTENGSISFRKLAEGSFTGQILPTAETFLGESVSAENGRAIGFRVIDATENKTSRTGIRKT